VRPKLGSYCTVASGPSATHRLDDPELHSLGNRRPFYTPLHFLLLAAARRAGILPTGEVRGEETVLARLRKALDRRYAAVVDAEPLIWQHGGGGVAMAQAAAANAPDEERRAHWRCVARIAEERLVPDLDEILEIGSNWATSGRK
jgi:hypothetical protein